MSLRIAYLALTESHPHSQEHRFHYLLINAKLNVS